MSNFMIGYCIVTSLLFVWNMFIFYKRNDDRVTLGSLLLSTFGSLLPFGNIVFSVILLLDTISNCVLDDEIASIRELADITLYEKDKADE